MASTEEQKAKKREYNNSEAGRLSKARYRASQKGIKAERAGAKAYTRTPKGKYCRQKIHARQRGIEWEFTFDLWWEMWEPHWENRGCTAGKFVMCRAADKGPYSPANCRIDTMENNIKEAWQVAINPQTARYTGNL